VKGSFGGFKTPQRLGMKGYGTDYVGEIPAQAGYADADGLETVADWDCVPDCAVRLLGEQSGMTKSTRTMRGELVDNRGDNYNRANGRRIAGSDYERGHSDTGTAARFFKNFDPPLRFKYSAKASRAERDAGRASRNTNPCVKPLAVTRYLATLLRPPEAYLDDATLLVPFAGSGSEMIGALLAGWRNVVGIELEQEYVDIAQARLAALPLQQAEMFNQKGG
jgi:hypothetical protein